MSERENLITARIATGFLFIYVLALHSSIALMEIASWTLFGLSLYRSIRGKTGFWFPYWRVFFGLAAVVGVGLILNPPLAPWIDQIGFMRWILLMYALAWLLADIWNEKLESALVKFWVVCVAVTGIYAFIQCLTGIDIVRPGTDTVANQGGVWRSTAWFSASLTFGYCIGYLFFTVAFPAGRQKSAIWKWLAVIAGVLGVLASLSRGAWIGMVAAGMFYFLCERRRLIPWFLGGLALAIGGALTFNRYLAIKLTDMMNLHPDHSSMMRLHLWRAAIGMWRDHFWFGTGIFQTEYHLKEYYERFGIDETFVSHSHNVLLQWLAGTGLIGFLFWLAVLFVVFRMAWRLRSVSAWGWGLLLANIFVHVGGLTENNFFDGEVNHNIMFGWALLLALNHKAFSRGYQR